MKDWQKELDTLTTEHETESAQLKPIRDELKELYSIKSKLGPFLCEAAQDKKNETRKENYAQEEETY